MIGIRPEQVAALGADRREDFLRRLVVHLRKHYAGKTAAYSDEQLRDYAERCIDRARTYGLTTERAVACYAQLHWVLGLNFEADPRRRYAVDMLRDDRYDQNERAKLTLALAHQLAAGGW